MREAAERTRKAASEAAEGTAKGMTSLL